MAMAEGVRRVLGADVGLALTGVAGPAEQDGQPVGTVFVGLCIGGAVEAAQLRLPGDRDQMRQFASDLRAQPAALRLPAIGWSG